MALAAQSRAVASFLRVFWITHNDTPQSVDLLCTSDQLITETSYLTTQNTHNRQTSMPRRDSNPQSQQASGRRPTL